MKRFFKSLMPFFVVVPVLVIMSACNNDKPQTPENTIEGTYKFYSLTIDDVTITKNDVEFVNTMPVINAEKVTEFTAVITKYAINSITIESVTAQYRIMEKAYQDDTEGEYAGKLDELSQNGGDLLADKFDEMIRAGLDSNDDKNEVADALSALDLTAYSEYMENSMREIKEGALYAEYTAFEEYYNEGDEEEYSKNMELVSVMYTDEVAEKIDEVIKQGLTTADNEAEIKDAIAAFDFPSVFDRLIDVLSGSMLSVISNMVIMEYLLDSEKIAMVAGGIPVEYPAPMPYVLGEDNILKIDENSDSIYKWLKEKNQLEMSNKYSTGYGSSADKFSFLTMTLAFEKVVA